MLICTDKAAIDAAFTDKTPRPIRDVMLEIYPDATEDRNGRFHAPYDGYECPITGGTFRAGEYLPMEEPEDGYRIMSSGKPRNVPHAWCVETSTVAEWDGTRTQNAAVWSLLLAQSKAHDAQHSNHIGFVGGMFEFNAVVSHVHTYEGYYGLVYINILKSGDNVVVYKGAKALAEKGAAIRLRAKVKEHGERDGVKQTIVERPKVLSVTSKSKAAATWDDLDANMQARMQARRSDPRRVQLRADLLQGVAEGIFDNDTMLKSLADYDAMVENRETGR